MNFKNVHDDFAPIKLGNHLRAPIYTDVHEEPTTSQSAVSHSLIGWLIDHMQQSFSGAGVVVSR